MKNRALFVLALLVAVLVVFAVHSEDFPGSVPNFERLSGGGALLDVKPSFSEEAIYQRLSGYGEQGRDNYAFRNITVDILLPLAVFPALFLLMLHALEGSSIGRVPRSLSENPLNSGYTFRFGLRKVEASPNDVLRARFRSEERERLNSVPDLQPRSAKAAA